MLMFCRSILRTSDPPPPRDRVARLENYTKSVVHDIHNKLIYSDGYGHVGQGHDSSRHP